MSEPSKLDPARAWMFVEKLLAEDAAERVESLSDAQVDEELRRAGFDPERLPGADPILARSAERAAERDRANESREAARVVVLSERRRTRWVLTLVAAMFVLVVAVVVTKGPAIATYFKDDKHDRHDVIGPDNEWAQRTPHEQAEALRDQAMGSCEGWLWAQCRKQLDEAKQLDPAGESAERVQRARKEIQAKLNPEGGVDKK